MQQPSQISRDSALHYTAAHSGMTQRARRPSLEQGLQQAEGHVRLLALHGPEAVRKALLPQTPVPARPHAHALSMLCHYATGVHGAARRNALWGSHWICLARAMKAGKAYTLEH